MKGSENAMHAREREVFLQALDVDDPTERHAFLDEACLEDGGLRNRVESLLTASEDSTVFLHNSNARELFEGCAPTAKKGPGWEPPEVEALDRCLPDVKILELIGRGGMGAVYWGEQLRLEREVAVKILPPEIAKKEQFAERFRREALTMAKLKHTNIVTIYDFGEVEMPEVGPLLYIVMEYVAGTDLHHLIRSGNLDVPAALEVVGQICEALQFAHNEGFVHRDIKPANILITSGGKVKVGDFGLAKLTANSPNNTSDLTLSGSVVGTPFYMAPEASKPGKVDHRADIYSLGILFYEMLTGTVPKGVFARPSEKAEIDVRLDEVVLKALQEEPDRRYQQASEVQTDVRAISSTTGSNEAQAWGNKLRGRRPWLLFAAVALLVTIGLMLFPWEGTDPADPAPAPTAAIPEPFAAESSAQVASGARASDPIPLSPLVHPERDKTMGSPCLVEGDDLVFDFPADAARGDYYGHDSVLIPVRVDGAYRLDLSMERNHKGTWHVTLPVGNRSITAFFDNTGILRLQPEPGPVRPLMQQEWDAKRLGVLPVSFHVDTEMENNEVEVSVTLAETNRVLRWRGARGSLPVPEEPAQPEFGHASGWIRFQEPRITLLDGGSLQPLYDPTTGAEVPRPPQLVRRTALLRILGSNAYAQYLGSDGLPVKVMNEADIPQAPFRLERMQFGPGEGYDSARVGDILQFPELSTLILFAAPVTDADLQRLTGLTNLFELAITGSELTGAGLQNVASFTSLKHLQIGSAKHLEPVSLLSAFPNLERVTWANSHFHSLEPALELPRLKKLFLVGASPRGLPKTMETVPENLEEIWLDGCELTVEELLRLANIPSLKRIRINSRNITAADGPKIAAALPSFRLELKPVNSSIMFHLSREE